MDGQALVLWLALAEDLAAVAEIALGQPVARELHIEDGCVGVILPPEEPGTAEDGPSPVDRAWAALTAREHWRLLAGRLQARPGESPDELHERELRAFGQWLHSPAAAGLMRERAQFPQATGACDTEDSMNRTGGCTND